jgi:hypothetical protein
LKGAAIIHLRAGTFVATRAELVHGVVTFHGCLQVQDLTGTRTYPQRVRSHRLGRREWIEWTEREEIAA